MKKIVSIFLALVSLLCVFSFTACGKSGGSNIVTLEDISTSNDDVVSALASGQFSTGLLPEPYATKLEKLSNKSWNRVALHKYYDEQTQSYPQAVLMIKSSLLSTLPEIVSGIESKFTGGVAWTIENLSDAVTAINGKLPNGVIPTLDAEYLTSQAVMNCNIRWESASDAKTSVKEYIDDIIANTSDGILAQATKITDDFFYSGDETGNFNSNTIHVYMPDGAPAVAFAAHIYNNEMFGINRLFNYHVIPTSDVGTTFTSGNADIMVMPINAASKLYKKNSDDPYKMVAVLTHGNLYAMSTQKLSSVNSLKGKTIALSGIDLVPGLTLKTVLKKHGISWDLAI